MRVIISAYAIIFLVGLVGFQPCFAQMSTKQIQTLREALKDVPIEEEILQDFITNFDGIRAWIERDIISPTSVGKASATCQLCTLIIGIGLSIIRSGLDLEIIKIILAVVCELLSLTGLAANVCNGAVGLYADPLKFILTEHAAIKASDICGIYTGAEGGCDPIHEDFRNWKIDINEDKPALQNRPALPPTTEAVKILQLTDIHPDLHYVVGSDNACGEPMCCRGPIVSDENRKAGVHGDYTCDMPRGAMLELFENAANRFEYEFVLMTGDLVHHQIWNTTKVDNLVHYDSVNIPLVTEYFPDTPIYPVIGNHEPHPCNMFPPESIWATNPEYDLSYLYDNIAESYKRWLPEDALTSFRKAGYYTLIIPNTDLRLISINTNFCYTNNFWIFLNPVDPENQLQWLSNTLEAAEAKNEVVYIAGHIPPGKSDCWTVWNKKFHDIIIRYEDIIRAQFYGHTHNDETTIFFDKSVYPPRPANVLNIGVSTTAYTYLNPGYKVYYADGKGEARTWEMMDHETYVYDLAEANAAAPGTKPVWRHLYSMKEAFGLNSLRPADLYNMVVKMVDDDALFQKYHRFYHKDSHVASPCTTKECRMNYLCEMVKADSGDFSHCARLHFPDVTTEPAVTVTEPSEHTTEGSGGATPSGRASSYIVANILLSVVLFVYFN